MIFHIKAVCCGRLVCLLNFLIYPMLVLELNEHKNFVDITLIKTTVMKASILSFLAE
jgi:hypothetical protein